MTDREATILKNRLIPVPQNCKFGDGKPYRLEDGCSIVIDYPEPGVELCRDIDEITRLYWGVRADFQWNSAVNSIPPEGYRMKADEKVLKIEASDRTGILNALKTLRQLAERERGKEASSVFEADPFEIEDAPKLKFRGLHICWFPENQEWQIERAIRMAAYCKFNYVVLETWGVFPFEKHPYLCWKQPGCHISKEDIRRLVKEAARHGVTVIPQFNLLGHASGSRENGGKHVIENQFPEAMSLVEPDGWSWCLSNPETRKVLTDCVDEMLECFGHSGFFHAGCDEARLVGTCRSCRKQNLPDLMKDHLLYFYDYLKQHGARMMMWHDMLLNSDDPRWYGYIACGKEAEELGKLYQELPKDMIICDWQYGYFVDEQGNPP